MAKNNQMALKPGINNGGFLGSTLQMLAKSPDLALAFGVILILALLVIPLPPAILDILIAFNMAFSVLILFVSIYLVSPLEISSFPTILLLTTLFRLGLNVASLRLILGEGQAGEIIHAFGSFVIKGNYVVGIIIFIVLLLINFVVVIKGSSRIAEVAARFTLDALPGKQMSIDADLNAGYIDEKTARKRREELTRESDFYGSMDGSAKFIKGDAIAGLVITAINILAGFVIGMTQLGMSLSEALSTYTILTIGDGLVAQIPALLISVASGIVVTRSASAKRLSDELGDQLGAKPKVLALASGTMIVFAFIPGFPAIPFLILAVGTGAAAYYRNKAIEKEEDDILKEALAEKEQVAKPEEQPVEELLKVDPVEIDLGYSLIALVDETQGGDVFKRITNVRRQLATELGIILPPVRVRDNLQLEAEEYVIKIRSNELARNVLYPNMLLAMNPGTAEGDIAGIKVTEPVFGLPATWVSHAERENAEVLGYTVVESATVLTTHLTELLRRSADKLLTRQDVRFLIDNLKSDYPALVDEMKDENLPLSIVQKTLQNLLKEGIPVRDLPIIMESLLEYAKVTKNVDVLTEYVRHNLSETIKKLYQDQNGTIHTIALAPQLEQVMTNSLQTNNQAVTSPTMGLTNESIKTIQNSLSAAIDEISLAGYLPVVICSAQIRPYFARLIRSQFPMVAVISYTEIPSDTDIEIQASISM
jgi:flagellar biosynthesis protein FlhA